jgi:hypothetical protein
MWCWFWRIFSLRDVACKTSARNSFLFEFKAALWASGVQQVVRSPAEAVEPWWVPRATDAVVSESNYFPAPSSGTTKPRKMAWTQKRTLKVCSRCLGLSRKGSLSALLLLGVVYLSIVDTNLWHKEYYIFYPLASCLVDCTAYMISVRQLRGDFPHDFRRLPTCHDLRRLLHDFCRHAFLLMLLLLEDWKTMFWLCQKIKGGLRWLLRRYMWIPLDDWLWLDDNVLMPPENHRNLRMLKGWYNLLIVNGWMTMIALTTRHVQLRLLNPEGDIGWMAGCQGQRRFYRKYSRVTYYIFQ